MNVPASSAHREMRLKRSTSDRVTKYRQFF